MDITRDQVRDYVLQKLQELSQDWDNPASPADVSQASLLFSELGFESLDAVVLGVAIQEHFGCPLPFAELLAELGERRRDLSIGELIDFVYLHLSPTVVEPQRV
jgi:acyl carrier protein